MKKIALILFLLILLSSTVIANGDDDKEWKTVSTWSGTFYALSPESYPIDMQILSWDEIKQNYPDSILFNLSLIPAYPIQGQDFELSDYFIENQEIIGIKCYIDNLNTENVISNVTLTIIDPNGDVYKNFYFLESNFSGTNTVEVNLLTNKSLIFPYQGLWKFKISFDSNKKSLIWRFVGNDYYQTYMPDPNRGQHRDLKYIAFYNEYREGLPVITLTEALEVISTRYNALQTEYLLKSAEAQNESALAQKLLANATSQSLNEMINSNWLAIVAAFLLVIATVAYGIVVGKDYSLRKRERRKQLIERKLNGLYSPLFTNIKSTEQLHNIKTLSFKAPPPGKTQSQEKDEFDKLISENLHLASSKLSPLLIEVHHLNSRRISRQKAKEIAELIESEYHSLYSELGI